MLSRTDQGFTLIEITIAIVILTVAILGVAVSTGRMMGPAADAELEFQALQVVEDRLAVISLDPRYTELEALYEGTEEGLSGLLENMTRTTEITRRSTEVPDGNGGVQGVWDRTEVQVTVSGGRLREPVVRTLTLGAP